MAVEIRLSHEKAPHSLPLILSFLGAPPLASPIWSNDMKDHGDPTEVGWITMSDTKCFAWCLSFEERDARFQRTYDPEFDEKCECDHGNCIGVGETLTQSSSQ